LGRRRAVAGRHRAIGLLVGDLLRPGHALRGVAERAVLGAEHAQTELHRARRLGAKLVEYLDVGDAGDHETICMSSSSVLLTTEMTWAEAWKACWKLSR